MKLYRFDAEAGRQITRFDSRNVRMLGIVRTPGPVQIGSVHLEAGGTIGYHQAVVDQLFLVVAGEGWVTGEDRLKQAVAVGQAAFWMGGEWHESGTRSGMTALIVEGQGIEPERRMRRLN